MAIPTQFNPMAISGIQQQLTGQPVNTIPQQDNSLAAYITDQQNKAIQADQQAWFDGHRTSLSPAAQRDMVAEMEQAKQLEYSDINNYNNKTKFKNTFNDFSKLFGNEAGYVHPNTVKQMQAEYNKNFAGTEGFIPLAVDGKWGKNTNAAYLKMSGKGSPQSTSSYDYAKVKANKDARMGKLIADEQIRQAQAFQDLVPAINANEALPSGMKSKDLRTVQQIDTMNQVMGNNNNRFKKHAGTGITEEDFNNWYDKVTNWF